MSIRVLSEHVQNRIAAGEVIERPASVVKELVENSLDALADVIAVDVREGGTDMIRITDNGHGIPVEQLEQIFDAFFTTKTRGRGTGLGLALAQSVLHSHGGRIAVSSEPGSGTTFRILLPVAGPQPA